MEPPVSFEADAVRDEKAKVLQAISPIANQEVLVRTVRGQYGEGTLASGDQVPAYRSEPRVAPDSETPTYVALKVLIDNWRWADVPFYLRTGKRLPERVTEIAIQFKQAPFRLFRDTPVDELSSNVLLLRIQPAEGIALHFDAKLPAATMKIGGVDMDFCYADYFGTTPLHGLRDAPLRLHERWTRPLFQRADHVEDAWRIVTPILDVWKTPAPARVPQLRVGLLGPA